MKRLALVGLLWLGMGGVAQGYSHPTALITTLPTQFPYYIWVGEAKVPTPERLWIVESYCPTVTAAACTDGNTIWFSDAFGSYETSRSIFLHEVGHAFAIERGLPVGQIDDFAGERFADSYSLCATGWKRNLTYGRRHQWIDGPTALAFRIPALQNTCRSIRAMP